MQKPKGPRANFACSGVITTKVRRGVLAAHFGRVPDAIYADQSLCLNARLVVGWVAGRAPGYRVTPAGVTEQLGLTPSQWRRIALELAEAGIYNRKLVSKGRGAAGWVLEWDLRRFYSLTPDLADEAANDPDEDFDLPKTANR